MIKGAARSNVKPDTTKDCHRVNQVASKLGKDLRRISGKIAASGEKLLTRRELEREIANRRAGNC